MPWKKPQEASAMCPPQHPLSRKGCERGIPLGRLRHRRHAATAPHEMDMLTVPAPHDAPIKELLTRTVPPTHPRTADVLHGVLGSRVGVAGDVEGTDARGVMLRRTEGHDRTPKSHLTRAVCSARIRSPTLVRVSGLGVRSQVDSSRSAAGMRAFMPHPHRPARGCSPRRAARRMQRRQSAASHS
jgi:hypothetical protein